MVRVSALVLVVAVVACAGCGGGAHSHAILPEVPTTRVQVGSVSAAVPSGWHVFRGHLTSVSSPVQRLVVASFPVRQARPDGGCSPATAVGQMPPAGALLFMFEYQGPTRHDVERVPARPAAFRLDRRSLGNYECMGRSYSVRFRDRGRVFQAHLYFGAKATATTRQRLLGVLDSLRIAARRPGN
jgi:hypothetical protein